MPGCIAVGPRPAEIVRGRQLFALSRGFELLVRFRPSRRPLFLAFGSGVRRSLLGDRGQRRAIVWAVGRRAARSPSVPFHPGRRASDCSALCWALRSLASADSTVASRSPRVLIRSTSPARSSTMTRPAGTGGLAARRASRASRASRDARTASNLVARARPSLRIAALPSAGSSESPSLRFGARDLGEQGTRGRAAASAGPAPADRPRQLCGRHGRLEPLDRVGLARRPRGLQLHHAPTAFFDFGTERRDSAGGFVAPGDGAGGSPKSSGSSGTGPRGARGRHGLWPVGRTAAAVADPDESAVLGLEAVLLGLGRVAEPDGLVVLALESAPSSVGSEIARPRAASAPGSSTRH